MNSVRELLNQLLNLFRWWVIVVPWEQGVRVRLGKHVTVLRAGAHFRVPVLDKVYKQSVRRRFSITGVQTLTTSDGQALTISGELGYAISDILRLYDTLHHAEDSIESEVRALVADFVAGQTLSECRPAALMEAVNTALDLSKYGLTSSYWYVSTFAAVKTYRLLQGEPRDWARGGSLTMDTEVTAEV